MTGLRPTEMTAAPRAWGLTGALVLSMLAAGIAPAARAAEPLRYKFKAGETLRYTLVQDQKQERQVPGAEMSLASVQTVDWHWTVRAVDAGGVADVAQTFDRIRWKLTAPGATIEVDTANPKASGSPEAAQVMPLIRALAGAEYTFKVSPNGEITDVRVPAKLVQAIQEANPGAGAGGMFSEEGLKNLVAQSLLTLPKKAMEKGAEWSDHNRVAEPLIGAIVMDKRYTFEGTSAKDPRLVTFAMKTDFRIEPTAEAAGATKVDSYDGKGQYTFDSEAGRIISSQVSEKLAMTHTIKDPQTGRSQQIKQASEVVNTMTFAGTGDAK